GREVADGLCTIVDRCAADLLEAEGRVERIGYGIGRLQIDLADHGDMAEMRSALECLAIKQATKTVPAVFFGDHHPVDVEEFFEPAAEPEKVAAVIVVRMREG